MGRLLTTKFDEKRWKVIETDNINYHSYKLIDMENEETYILNRIVGFEQVGEDEFLVYHKKNYTEFEICRFKLQKSEFVQLFAKEFSQFYFITDDRIMFSYLGNNGTYRCGGIYSIKDNKMLEEAKWLEGMNIDPYEVDDDPERKILYVEITLPSYKLGDSKLLFTVDPETLQPNSDCYSQLRDSFIKVSDKEDIESIKLEDKKSNEIIEKQIYQQDREQLKKAKAKVLERKNN